jgi:protein TonB
VSALARGHGDGAHEGARWSVCLIVACALHIGAAAAIWLNKSEPQLMDAAPPVALIDLAPLPVPAAAPPPPPPPQPEPEQPEIKEEPPPPEAVVLPKPPPPKPPAPRQQKPVEYTAPTPPIPAAPVQSTPAPAQSAAVPTVDIRRIWERELLTRLDRFKRYPRRAQLRRQEGVAYLRFTVARNGDVLSYALHRSSGSEALDEETLTLIERAKPLPPMPADMREDRVELIVPVRYTLR